MTPVSDVWLQITPKLFNESIVLLDVRCQSAAILEQQELFRIRSGVSVQPMIAEVEDIIVNFKLYITLRIY